MTQQQLDTIFKANSVFLLSFISAIALISRSPDISRTYTRTFFINYVKYILQHFTIILSNTLSVKPLAQNFHTGSLSQNSNMSTQ